MELPELSDASGRPVHQQISDALAAAIDDGRYARGSRFPGENAIMKTYGVARGTARQALQTLSDGNYIRTEPKIGTFVRDDNRLIRKPRRYRRKKGAPFATDVRSAGLQPEVQASTVIVFATEEIAERLKIPQGNSVVRTQYKFLASEAVVQLSTSYEPHELTRGTAVEIPEEGPLAGEGVVNRFDSLNLKIDHVTEEVTVRPTRGTEAEELGIESTDQVFVIKRTFEFAERPMETADIVIPADRYSLFYRFAIPEGDDDPETA